MASFSSLSFPFLSLADSTTFSLPFLLPPRTFVSSFSNHILILLFLSFSFSFFSFSCYHDEPYPPLSSLVTLDTFYIVTRPLPSSSISINFPLTPLLSPLQFHLIFILIPPSIPLSCFPHFPHPHSNEFLSPVPSFPLLSSPPAFLSLSIHLSTPRPPFPFPPFVP